MTVKVIKMPDIGEGIAEVELVAWHVRPGDAVVEDQALADVMTDKASVEIPSPVVGTVLALGGDVGQTLAVGSELIRIEVGAPAQPPAESPAASPAASPATASFAMHEPESLASGRPLASPSVRRRAREMGLVLTEVTGTGPNGRVMQADLESAATARRHPERSEGSRPRESTRSFADAQDDRPHTEVVRIIGLRRRIAQKMQEAKRRIPHFTYVEEVDVTELERLRAVLNARFGSARGKLTLLPFLVRAIVRGIAEFPQVNARFDDDAETLTRHRAAHIGIATQTDAGLVVPVLRDAGSRTLWQNAAEIARLAEAARGGKASRDELSGSTITITSLGALGGIVTTPVINHPEVAIVGVNRIVERPVFERGAVVPRLMMNLSSSFDHRIVDGIDAARFVQALRGMLEAPATLFVE